LFSPFSLGPVSLPNRIVIAPMCQYSADNGCATDWHHIHLGHLALSGASLMLIEATAVEAIGRISPKDLGLWSDDTEAALREVIASIRRHSPMRLGIQLAHAGRKASTKVPWEGSSLIDLAQGGWTTVGPSAEAHTPGDPPPHALSADELTALCETFAAATCRAVALGFDVIELHAAHGYLLHQFLSPLANHRTDDHGGSLENRLRFPLAVFEAVRAAAGAVPVGVRLSATDWVDGGWDLDQSVAFSQALAARGAAFIDVSSGGVSTLQKVKVSPGYQVDFAERIRRESGLPTIAVGLITEAAQAEAILTQGQADLVALARGMLYDPRWPWHAAATLGARVEAPPQYWRSQPRELKDLFDTAAPK
jgi:2,4-dienoyl-CoA reductase-like NADH-dependent reductase (Old Yellow Enzyme family)